MKKLTLAAAFAAMATSAFAADPVMAMSSWNTKTSANRSSGI
jgi:opacity protein-like surface antigen